MTDDKKVNCRFHEICRKLWLGCPLEYGTIKLKEDCYIFNLNKKTCKVSMTLNEQIEKFKDW